MFPLRFLVPRECYLDGATRGELRKGRRCAGERFVLKCHFSLHTSRLLRPLSRVTHSFPTNAFPRLLIRVLCWSLLSFAFFLSSLFLLCLSLLSSLRLASSRLVSSLFFLRFHFCVCVCVCHVVCRFFFIPFIYFLTSHL